MGKVVKLKSKRKTALFHYKTYNFVDKDPVIDRVRTLIKDENLDYQDVFLLSGVARQTIWNWMEGETRRPQYATIAAVTSALGYAQEFVKVRKINFATELDKAHAEIAAAAKKKRA